MMELKTTMLELTTTVVKLKATVTHVGTYAAFLVSSMLKSISSSLSASLESDFSKAHAVSAPPMWVTRKELQHLSLFPWQQNPVQKRKRDTSPMWSLPAFQKSRARPFLFSSTDHRSSSRSALSKSLWMLCLPRFFKARPVGGGDTDVTIHPQEGMWPSTSYTCHKIWPERGVLRLW